MSERQANRLIREKSPYLLQHAYNPVDWYPWCDEAFERAVKEDRPVLLSIGYSTCHWCHVMEKESFEDPKVAKLMNESLVSIKVDREERPDLDHVYMTVSQMLTGGGGWPLNIIMTPDKRPFFAATYIPKESRFGRLGMKDLMGRIREIWQTRRDDVLRSADEIVKALHNMEKDAAGGDLDLTVLEKAYEELTQRYDKEYGGFSGAPKFPTPHNFLFLLRYWMRSRDGRALEMVERTLEGMRKGGIYDHLGFGFHRYSTDKRWLVPHFEKMLYDQAMLAMANLETHLATGKKTYADTAREIFTYVLRDMTGPEGGFYSGEDADSEGVEGKFYVWSEKELREVLPDEEANLVFRAFNVERDGNFREEPTQEKSGANILYLIKPIPEIAVELNMPEEDLTQRIASARKKLFEVRENRVHPHKDDKILTDWNGLMIAAFAQGARVLGDKTYEGAAKRAVEFIFNNLRKADGRLLHRFREGDAGITANLDDYAFLVWGLIELYETTFQSHYLESALHLNADMLAHYWDDQSGGLFFTPDDGEMLIIRKKEVYDGALPSGNAVAIFNLLRLARLTGDPTLEEKAAATIRAFSNQVKQLPSAYTQFLVSLDFALGRSYEVVIVGEPDREDTGAMLKALGTRFIPNQVTIFRPSHQGAPEIDRLAKFVKKYEAIDGKSTAYVCVANSCRAPTTDIKEMLHSLQIENG